MGYREKTVHSLQSRLLSLEDHSRQNNLIVFGVPEKTNEADDNLQESVVQGIFKNVLGVSVTTVERIHRIGRKQRDKPRPIVLKQIDYREKYVVFSNCANLKDTNFSISEDFSSATRQKRKKLWESAADLKRMGRKVKLVHDRIRIDNVLFEWDHAKGERVPVEGKEGKPVQKK
ncbi:hypothetical protein HPB48_023047 [Haemaphysalis longicornis]|uniref:Endonuclease-reverse transcriptase n=1 Tax=Haemaphysalis longicornis TaxID=44386 RepID=A0A9J6G9H4_HAELO|nr:hypothetical protein HPB48_023047 [Haemaphysalis longicornis]